MKLLHELNAFRTVAWIWVQMYGGNGHAIDPGPRGWNNPRAHLYEMHRRIPPARPRHLPAISLEDIRQRDLRVVWNPWPTRLDPLYIRTPLCGPLRTRARFLRPEFTSNWFNNNVSHCTFCEEIARTRSITPMYEAENRGADPWFTLITRDQRALAADPVTGI